MIDWNQLIGQLAPPTGITTLIAAILRFLWKYRKGLLVRAEARESETKAADRTIKRLYTYIYRLREDSIAHGHEPRPWPPSIQPKD